MHGETVKLLSRSSFPFLADDRQMKLYCALLLYRELPFYTDLWFCQAIQVLPYNYYITYILGACAVLIYRRLFLYVYSVVVYVECLTNKKISVKIKNSTTLYQISCLNAVRLNPGCILSDSFSSSPQNSLHRKLARLSRYCSCCPFLLTSKHEQFWCLVMS